MNDEKKVMSRTSTLANGTTVVESVKKIEPDIYQASVTKTKISKIPGKVSSKRVRGGICSSIINRIKQGPPILRKDLVKEIESKFPGSKVVNTVNSLICIHNKTANDGDKIVHDSQKRLVFKSSLKV